MNCKYCGQYYPDKEKNCPWCGNSMNRAERKASKRLSEENARTISCEEEIRGWKAFGAVNPKHPIARRQPVEAVLIGTHAEYRTKSGIGRGLLGWVLFGELGGFLGVASASRESKVRRITATFAVKYASGKIGSETVAVGSRRYEELIELGD